MPKSLIYLAYQSDVNESWILLIALLWNAPELMKLGIGKQDNY